jgi:ABC-type thiamine transport system substrate-binding protein
MTSPCDQAWECWERIKEDVSRAAGGGSAAFIDFESGSGPVHELCPIQRVAKL